MLQDLSLCQTSKEIVSVYYNDSEKFVCAWLRNLIAAKLLPAGDVDERPIQEVMPDDVRHYTQAHFFAGIGGWPYALQLAGWGDRPVWTGSCPCQPFSAAGQRKSHGDARHLWPAWFRLLAECRPVTVFGEQVSRAVGLGWIDAVRADMEGEGYAVGAVILGAHSVGAPHIRQRLYFVADDDRSRLPRSRMDEQQRQETPYARRASENVADAHSAGCTDAQRGERQAQQGGESQPRARHRGALQHATKQRQLTGRREQFPEARPTGWDMDFWLAEPAVDRVVDGLPSRVGILSGFGNAIVPQVAAAFVSAYMECAP